MSDSEDHEVKENPMPLHRIRFTDFEPAKVEKTIRMVDKINKGQKYDKDVAIAITKGIQEDPDLKDETAGWHVIVGKSFASSIQYQTKWVLFFDLLDGVNKSFLIFKTQ